MVVSLSMMIALLVVFQVKHLLADYPLQSAFMLRKFMPGWGFVLPLTAHAGVHALFTIAIVYYFTREPMLAMKLSAMDFVVHFVMDRIKASPRLMGRWKALAASEFATATPRQKLHNKLFWWALGLDQCVHHLTHYLIIYLMFTLP